ncbi:hypothetical protein P9156_10905 [Bacillus amyloliquefaciens]|nr:hypothetical protein [Bacillus amyloliquefaciens]
MAVFIRIKTSIIEFYPRLKDELTEVKKYLLNEPHDIKADNDMTSENADAVLQRETANVCLHALTDASVFKMTAEGIQAFQRFTKVLENGS